MAPDTIPPRLIAHDEDLAAWSAQQAAFLRSGQMALLDCGHLAEEIDDLGNSTRSEIENRLGVLVMHLLKWRYQPGRRSSSWRGSIIEQRNRLRRRIAESPSLKNHPGAVLTEIYESARLIAAGETELPEATFPETCPFTIEQMLDPDFWPAAAEAEHGP